MNYQQMLWLKRIRQREEDKRLAEQCGLKARDLCVHEDDGNYYLTQPPQTKCKKCGEFYR